MAGPWWNDPAKAADIVSAVPDRPCDQGVATAFLGLHAGGRAVLKWLASEHVPDGSMAASFSRHVAVDKVNAALDSCGVHEDDVLGSAPADAGARVDRWIAAGVPATVACVRAGLVFGVSDKHLGEFDRLASKPVSSPLAVESAANEAVSRQAHAFMIERSMSKSDNMRVRTQDKKPQERWDESKVNRDEDGRFSDKDRRARRLRRMSRMAAVEREQAKAKDSAAVSEKDKVETRDDRGRAVASSREVVDERDAGANRNVDNSRRVVEYDTSSAPKSINDLNQIPPDALNEYTLRGRSVDLLTSSMSDKDRLQYLLDLLNNEDLVHDQIPDSFRVNSDGSYTTADDDDGSHQLVIANGNRKEMTGIEMSVDPSVKAFRKDKNSGEYLLDLEMDNLRLVHFKQREAIPTFILTSAGTTDEELREAAIKMFGNFGKSDGWDESEHKRDEDGRFTHKNQQRASTATMDRAPNSEQRRQERRKRRARAYQQQKERASAGEQQGLRTASEKRELRGRESLSHMSARHKRELSSNRVAVSADRTQTAAGSRSLGRNAPKPVQPSEVKLMNDGFGMGGYSRKRVDLDTYAGDTNSDIDSSDLGARLHAVMTGDESRVNANYLRLEDMHESARSLFRSNFQSGMKRGYADQDVEEFADFLETGREPDTAYFISLDQTMDNSYGQDNRPIVNTVTGNSLESFINSSEPMADVSVPPDSGYSPGDVVRSDVLFGKEDPRSSVTVVHGGKIYNGPVLLRIADPNAVYDVVKHFDGLSWLR